MDLYTNGTILTMTEPETVEAVLTDNGKIVAVGTRSALENRNTEANVIDLNGMTMMPAFIDPHSHFSSYATSFLQAPLEECRNFEEIGMRLKAFIKERGIEPGQWIIAKGYDHNSLEEQCHPTLAFLDAYVPDHPVVLQHASGHVGVFNTMALKELGVTGETQSPEGGKIGMENGEPNGYMEENAMFVYMKKVPSPGMEDLIGAYAKAQAGYASRGIATIQEGMAVAQLIPLYQYLEKAGMLYLDVVAYAAMADAEAFLSAFPGAVRQYDGHLKIGGYKIFLDGSPQGRTAWMRKPYLGEDPSYCGYGTMKDEEVLAAVEKAAESGMQILAHCNGDAAAEQYLDAVARVEETKDVAAVRPVMIHAQLVGRDQLPRLKKLGVIPSFFVAHVYHWGDTHMKNFGIERARAISPTASALENGLLFTFHQDAPVIEPDMLETIWCAVNRKTKSGVLLGEEERISVREALKAVTINAAYQYFEEDRKGSIEPGKDADFVLLDRNPLTENAETLREIRIMETRKRGKTIYRR